MKRTDRPEAELIARAQHGDSQAFGELYLMHLDAIYGYIGKRVGEDREVEDLTQAVFLKAWQALDRYRPTAVPFAAWLYRIAHNVVVDHYRTKRESVSLDDQAMLATVRDVSVELPEQAAMSQERAAGLRRAMSRLRPPYQQVLALRFLSGLDYGETAQVLGRSVGNVRVLQFRALRALRREWLQEEMG